MGENIQFFSVKSVSGQICGQKFFAGHEGGGKTRKREENGDFASFRRSVHEAVTRSQTSRATSCATPRLVKIFNFCGQIRKWSNLWSKVFLPKHTAAEKRENARKAEILRAFGVRLMRRSHAPKRRALPTATTPRHCFIIADFGRFVKTKNNIVGKYIPAQWYIVGAVRVASTWRRLAGKTAVWQ